MTESQIKGNILCLQAVVKCLKYPRGTQQYLCESFEFCITALGWTFKELQRLDMKSVGVKTQNSQIMCELGFVLSF